MANFIRRLILALGSIALITSVHAEEVFVLASTTSTEQSGLFGYLLPLFTAKTGIQIKLVALGTGQALDTGRRGDADVLLVHDRSAEEKFIDEGWGVERREVMYNDFILVGPKNDPAKIKSALDATDAFKRMAATDAPFISRGDKSGTNAAELRFWQAAEIDPKANSGYKEAGTGMGPTLNMAAALNGYTLSDRGTWLAFKNRQDLEMLFTGDRRMINPYGVMLVNPAKYPHVKKEIGMKFIEWITSQEGQSAIAGYKINGEQLFFPDANN